MLLEDSSPRPPSAAVLTDQPRGRVQHIFSTSRRNVILRCGRPFKTRGRPYTEGALACAATDTEPAHGAAVGSPQFNSSGSCAIATLTTKSYADDEVFGIALKASILFRLILLLFAAGNCLALAPPARAQAVDAAAGRSTLRGRVVYADTGNPVRRAEVTLMNAATGESLGVAVTDAKGAFSIKNLTAGRYSVAAAAPSLISPRALARHEATADALDLAEELSVLIEVEIDGARNADVLIRARRGGAITGRVTSEDGEPVAGAQLRLFRLRRGRPERVALTWEPRGVERKHPAADSRGVYRIAGLPAGEYLVRASESDLGAAGGEGEAYGDGSLVVSYFPSAASIKDAAPVRVYEGRDADGVDIRIHDRPARKLGGTVTLKRGAGPVARAEIKVSRRDEPLPPLHGFGDDESAMTDAAGRWEVSGLPDGEYVITVSSIFTLRAAAPGGARDVRIVPARKEVTVAGGDLNDVKIELEEAVSVSGTVTVEGGAPFTQLVRVETLRGGEVSDSSYIRDGGRFVLDMVPAGELRIRVAGFDESRFYVKSLVWNQVDLTREPLRVGERAKVEGVRAVLATDVATIKGQAFSRGGDGRTAAPLANALVALVAADEKLRSAKARPRVVRADAAGRFEIANGPGEYLLVALSERAALRQNVKLDEEYIRRNLPTLTRVALRAGAKVSDVKVFGRDE